MQIVILRHGETEQNRQRIIQGRRVDSQLNELGHAQAEAFFEAYKHVDFQLLVTSPLQRTHQTIRRFIEQETPWIQHPDIIEMDWGYQEGAPSTPEQKADYEAVVAEWQSGNLDVALGGGESARELGERLARFIEWLKTRPADRLLICTHGRAMRGLVTLLKERPLSDMENVTHSNTATYIAHMHEGRFFFEVENDTRHLDKLASNSLISVG